jgi:hypothetical protein
MHQFLAFVDVSLLDKKHKEDFGKKAVLRINCGEH